MKAKTISVIAGFTFFIIALFIQGILPYIMKTPHITKVTKLVRTSLGELKEIKADPLPYNELIIKGRKIYIKEGCWYCHSQYIRPIAGEDKRWGPVSEYGEYTYELPHLVGTRRIGPDLLRVGGKYGDDWHAAHFFEPRSIVPDSIMPSFKWLFRKVDDHYELNDDGIALLAYVQNLGMNRGKWRDIISYQSISQNLQKSSELAIKEGKAIYLKRCAGCHGENGDGKGIATKYTLFKAAKPRDFTLGVYKFRTTPTGSLPLDSDIFRTITAGIRGTAMPSWSNLSETDRWNVIQYIKTFSEEFKNTTPELPIMLPPAPEPNEDLISKGATLFNELSCWECHGKTGRGDGPKSDTLKDDFGEKIKPPDFTKGIFKSGSSPSDIYRTLMTGLNGTPMPSYSDSIQNPSDTWALAYYILSLSKD